MGHTSPESGQPAYCTAGMVCVCGRECVLMCIKGNDAGEK